MSKQQPRRLGRGLSSLIPSDLDDSIPTDLVGSRIPVEIPAEPVSASQGRLMFIALERIRPNPEQPRRTFDESALNALAASLQEKGTLQPIVVRPLGGGFEIVAGERRYRAARLAGLVEIPAVVRAVTDGEMLELALVENIQRADLNPIERARGYQTLHERHSLTHDEIALRMGEDRATVANYVRLLSLCDEALRLVAGGQLTTGHGKALLAISDPRRQAELARKALAERWSVRQTEEASRGARPPEQAAAHGPISTRPAVSDLETRLQEILGVRVSIREGRKRHTGKIAIEYYSLDDFERITGRLGLDGEK